MIRALIALAFLAVPAAAAEPCASCAEWNAPQMPFRVYGNTYYVGPHGLAAVLITSDTGHVLIDGGLPESTGLIADNIAALGFHLQDVKVILNSHAHFDHAGGIAELQRATGAAVRASLPSIIEMIAGAPMPDDPQSVTANRFPPVLKATPVKDRRHYYLRRCQTHGAFHARSHARRHHLDLGVLRRRGLPPHGLRRQPVRRQNI